MNPLIDAKLSDIADLCDKHHVKFLALFGSITGDQFDRNKSDLDFIVEFFPMVAQIYIDA